MQAVPAGAGAGQYGTGGVSVHLAADAAPGAGTSSNVPSSSVTSSRVIAVAHDASTKLNLL